MLNENVGLIEFEMLCRKYGMVFSGDCGETGNAGIKIPLTSIKIVEGYINFAVRYVHITTVNHTQLQGLGHQLR
jgi:hypothetical protein